MNLKLGELLIQANLITNEQLETALETQKLFGGKLGTNLVELSYVSDQDLVLLLSKQLQMNAATSKEFDSIPNDVLKLIDKQYASDNKVVPLKLDTKLRLAVSDPGILMELDTLSFKLGKSIQPVIAPEIWIVAALERYYGFRRETRYISVDPTISTAVEKKSTPNDLGSIHDILELSDPIKPVVTAEAYIQLLLKAEFIQGVFNALFDFLNPIFSRMALYTVREETLHGFMLHGFPVHNKAFVESTIDWKKTDALKKIVERKLTAEDNPIATPADRSAFSILSITPTEDILLYPISFQGTVICVLLAIHSKDKTAYDLKTNQLIISALAKASYALEYIQARKKIMSELT